MGWPDRGDEERGCGIPGCSGVNMGANFSNITENGFVRLIGRELADRRRSRLLRGELTPFSECGSTVLLEVLTAF